MKLRRTLIAVAVLIVVAAGAFWWWTHRMPAQTPQNEAAPNVDVATARVASVDETVNALGRLGAGSGAQAKLAFVSAGRVGSVYVHVGDHVSAGQPLASLDTSTLVMAANAANADVRTAQAQAEAAAVDRTTTRLAVDRAALARERTLYNAGVAARKDIEAAQAQLAADEADAKSNAAGISAARAAVASAQAKAAGAAQDVSNATITAPQDGVVAAIYHTAGESVDPSTAVVALAASSTSAATLQVNANDAVRVHAGDAVTMSLQDGSKISGRVAGVSASVDPVTQQAEVRVQADVPSSLSGAAVTAAIVVGTDRGVTIPHDAVVIDPASGDALAFVLGKDKDGNPAYIQRKISVVRENATTALVTGVRAGERVAAKGTFELLAPADSGGD